MTEQPEELSRCLSSQMHDDEDETTPPIHAPLYSIPFTMSTCFGSTNTPTAARVQITPEKGYILKGEHPPHLILVLDRSGSMEGNNKMKNAHAAIRTLCGLCTDAYPIKVSIIAFDDNAVVAMQPTPSPTPDIVERALQSMRSGGGTNFIAGLNIAISIMTLNEPTVIVLFTDGQDASELRNGNAPIIDKLRMHTSLILHTVAIGHDADNDFLRRIANSTRCTGESVQVDARCVPSVMAALHASVVQSAIGPSAVEMHATDDDGNTVGRCSMPVVIQVAEDVEGNPMPIEAGFVVPAGTSNVKFSLKFCNADIVTSETVSIKTATIDLDAAAAAAAKFFVPCIATAAAAALRLDDADSALACVIQAIQTVRLMSLPTGDAITGDLTAIQHRVQALGIQLREKSDASTRTNTLAAIEDIAAGAQNSIRTSSGAMPLVETEDRSMSGLARTQSDAAFHNAVGEAEEDMSHYLTRS